jgi:hypothetical protein
MSDLEKLNYILQSWGVFSKVQEANGMVLKDQFTPGLNGKGFPATIGGPGGELSFQKGFSTMRREFLPLPLRFL